MRRSDRESYKLGPKNTRGRGMDQGLRARGHDEYWADVSREYSHHPRDRFPNRDRRGFAESFGRRLGESARNIFGGRNFEYGEHGAERSTDTRNFYGKGPKGWRRSDERIREEACEALYRSREVDASNIEVRVENGTVILQGSVDDRQTKREAENLVEEIGGVEDVRNEIRVQRESISNINQSKSPGQSSQLGSQGPADLS